MYGKHSFTIEYRGSTRSAIPSMTEKARKISAKYAGTCAV